MVNITAEPWVQSKQVHEGFAVDNVALRLVLLCILQCSPSSITHQGFILMLHPLPPMVCDLSNLQCCKMKKLYSLPFLHHNISKIMTIIITGSGCSA